MLVTMHRTALQIPRLRRVLARIMYWYIARRFPHDEWRFMNYGSAPSGPRESWFPLEAVDEADRFFIGPYHRLASAVDLAGRDVLEVGSGRGGGCSYLARYHAPRSVVGVDFSRRAVRQSRSLYRVPGLSFAWGDAERLPFGVGSFDAIVNVESSHCYASMERFLGEVRRVLRPGGAFLFADFRLAADLDALRGQFHDAGLTIVSETDLTSDVMASLDRDGERRLGWMHRRMKGFMLDTFVQFAGLRGSKIYEDFRMGLRRYVAFVLRA
jgi:SAM-dependent methyltransferase